MPVTGLGAAPGDGNGPPIVDVYSAVGGAGFQFTLSVVKDQSHYRGNATQIGESK